jgi:hypothetical protein
MPVLSDQSFVAGSAVAGSVVAGKRGQSAYQKFMSQHLKTAPGANQKDKFRAVAKMWQEQKGK